MGLLISEFCVLRPLKEHKSLFLDSFLRDESKKPLCVKLGIHNRGLQNHTTYKYIGPSSMLKATVSDRVRTRIHVS